MKIILRGDYYDGQTRNDKFFIWNTLGRLYMVDLRDDMIVRLIKRRGACHPK